MITQFSQIAARMFLLGVVAFCTMWAMDIYDGILRDPRTLDGWIMLVGILLLSGLHLRKKVPVLPLVPVKVWAAIHIYLGLFLVVIFFVHTSWAFPQGWFDWVLWCLFISVALSGIFGLTVLKFFPARLNRHGPDVILENIPSLQAEIATRVQDLASSLIERLGSKAVAHAYTAELLPYFAKRGSLVSPLREATESIDRVMRTLDQLQQYSDEVGRQTIEEIKALAVEKNRLDCHWALQMVMKGWMFVHIPATYALILAACVHTLSTYAFSMGAS